jgi:hypothetical protein
MHLNIKECKMNQEQKFDPNVALGVLGLYGVIFTISKELGTNVWIALAVGAFVSTICFFAYFSNLLSKSDKDKVQIIDDKGGGSVLIDDVKKSKTNIIATAFSAERPNEEYLKAMESRLGDGVSVSRVLFRHKDMDYSCFDNFGANTRKDLYRLCDYPHQLPFNMVVIDKKISWLFFQREDQASYYLKAIRIRNPEVAEMLTRVFYYLVNTSK